MCRRQNNYYRKSSLLENEEYLQKRIDIGVYKPIFSDKLSNKNSVNLISEVSVLPIEDVTLINRLDKIEDEQWIDDATGLIPHCLSILKICRYLTERLSTLALESFHSKNGLALIIDNAKKISSRVDDMVQSMYPPLDPRLLEARAAALTLAVSHLVLIARYECKDKQKNFSWIDESLNELNKNMEVLRNAATFQTSAIETEK